jgi:hypothetical protein
VQKGGLVVDELLHLTGRTIVQVRAMTEEECDREGWAGGLGAVCAVLDNGGILYPGTPNGEAPGAMLAQHAGELWEVSAEAEPSPMKVLARDILWRTEMLVTAMGIVLAVAGVAAFVHMFVEPDFLVLLLGVGEFAGAGVCAAVRSLVRASRVAVEGTATSSRVGKDV